MYDLIIRDATIVSSAGRLVADVAIKDGKFAYVGPRPPRRTKHELSAIGKFLLPGLIDTGASLSTDPAGWAVESAAAVTGGTTTVIDITPGSSDPASAKARLAAISKGSWCNTMVWCDARDPATAVATCAVPGVAGVLVDLGDGTTDPDTLSDFAEADGVLGVRYLGDPDKLRPNAEGIPEDSPEALAVMRLVRDQGHSVHWMHLSTSAELELVDPVRGDLPLTSSVSPHHLFLSNEETPDVQLVPPLRREQDRRTLWTAIKRSRLDCLASDHSTVAQGEVGAPGAELTLPLMLSAVRQGRLSLEQLAMLCAEGPAAVFGLENKGRIAKGADADLLLFTEDEIARVDLASLKSGAGWSPYDGRDASPKPDLVMVMGKTVAVRGEIAGDEPSGQPVS